MQRSLPLARNTGMAVDASIVVEEVDGVSFDLLDAGGLVVRPVPRRGRPRPQAHRREDEASSDDEQGGGDASKHGVTLDAQTGLRRSRNRMRLR